jgi:zinc transporter ZupT
MNKIYILLVLTGVIALDELTTKENVVKIIAFFVWILIGTMTQIGIRKVVLKQEIDIKRSFFIFFFSFTAGYLTFESMTNFNYITWRSVFVILSAMISEILLVLIYKNAPVFLWEVIKTKVNNHITINKNKDENENN